MEVVGTINKEVVFKYKISTIFLFNNEQATRYSTLAQNNTIIAGMMWAVGAHYYHYYHLNDN